MPRLPGDRLQPAAARPVSLVYGKWNEAARGEAVLMRLIGLAFSDKPEDRIRWCELMIMLNTAALFLFGLADLLRGVS